MNILIRIFGKDSQVVKIFQALLPIGLIILFAGTTMSYLITGIAIFDFLGGFLMGVGVPIVMFGLFYTCRRACSKRSSQTNTTEERE